MIPGSLFLSVQHRSQGSEVARRAQAPWASRALLPARPTPRTRRTLSSPIINIPRGITDTTRTNCMAPIVSSPASTPRIPRLRWDRFFYDTPISAENYKDKILFEITPEKLKEALTTGANHPGSSLVSLTLFEGASGNYRSPKPVPHGSVRVVGFPEWGSQISDNDGNLRIPNIPSRSELMVEAEAPGFYPTYQIVPTFGGSSYSTVALVSWDKVDAVRYFTKHPQRDGMAVVLGRVFDPDTRSPKEGEEFSLSFRKGRALYFGALPDTSLSSTTDTGLFGFLNIVPSFRSLLRENGRPAFLANFHPNTASYIELGRGGQKSFWGQLTIPSAAGYRPRRYAWSGMRDWSLTDENGIFRIDNIDFPPGALTIEVEAPNYPLTWATFPWSTRERETKHALFMMEKDIIGAAADSVARITRAPIWARLLGERSPLSSTRARPACMSHYWMVRAKRCPRITVPILSAAALMPINPFASARRLPDSPSLICRAENIS